MPPAQLLPSHTVPGKAPRSLGTGAITPWHPLCNPSLGSCGIPRAGNAAGAFCRRDADPARVLAGTELCLAPTTNLCPQSPVPRLVSPSPLAHQGC